ncbi:MAG: helix-turn-helix domain-containing protein [Ferruginibacter sp.]
MLIRDEENLNFTTAAAFINDSNYPVFLTGKAGTGKTTFLKYIKANSRKNIAVVAPTGVAAINAGGTTIHSFFQLPFSPFLPSAKNVFKNVLATDTHDLLSRLRLNNERKEILQELELLVIDEISMVRCDVLDAIDTVLRHVRNQRGKPFGGVQLLYIGDMYQLPPVINPEEWQLLSSCYENQYFFSSHVILEQPPVYIELDKVYRQTDIAFIDLLNKVRNNIMTEMDYSLLHTRLLPDFKPGKEDGFITLTTHNNKADTINFEALADIKAPTYCYKAIIEGEFAEKSFPADEYLNLKVGAQVMFIKNDNEKVRRYYNGKIGSVHKVEDEKIWVECKTNSERHLIEVKKEIWRNIRYTLNNSSRQIEEQELGCFTQYPLRLAWAITIHKSQGLTFEKAIIDAGSAFAAGQVYVALSRCTSLEGIVLKSKIVSKSLYSDRSIVKFSDDQENNIDKSKLLFEAGRQYQFGIIKGLFNFTEANRLLENFLLFIKENNSFGKEVPAWQEVLQQQLHTYVHHSKKFETILDGLFPDQDTLKENGLMEERIVKAANWFAHELVKTRSHILASPAITDNRQLSEDYNEKLEKLFQNICLRIHLLSSCKERFILKQLLDNKRCHKRPDFELNTYSGKAAHISNDVILPDLYRSLKKKRDEISIEKKLPVYMVCATQSLQLMANHLPRTLSELACISGFGKIKLKQFGTEFITIIQSYCAENEIENSFTIPIKEVNKKRNKKGKKEKDTKMATYELYKEGKVIKEIAATRKLTSSTIETHLAHFVETGDINIDEILDKKTQDQINTTIKNLSDVSLRSIKEQLPNASFGQIRWMIAYQKRQLHSN